MLHVLPPGPYGGAESVVAALARGGMAAGRSVQVASLAPGEDGRDYVAALRALGVPVHEIRAGRRGYLTEVRALADLIAAQRTTIVHTHVYRADAVGLLAARRRRVPVVATVHGHTGGPWRNRLYEFVDRVLLRYFDAVVCVSESMRTMLRNAGCRPERLHVVVNGPGTDEVLPRAAARQELGFPDGAPVAGFVGRLRVEKGPDRFVDAVAACGLPDCVGVIVGDGPERDAAMHRAVNLGVANRVRFAGSVPRAARIMRAFDVLVAPSRTEGTPMVILEAMAAGVPVVATDVGGIPRLLADDCGWLVPSGDGPALAAALSAALGDLDERRRRADNARARVAAEFGMPRWLVQLDDVYRDATARRNGA